MKTSYSGWTHLSKKYLSMAIHTDGMIEHLCDNVTRKACKKKFNGACLEHETTLEAAPTSFAKKLFNECRKVKIITTIESR